jgi:hypothetical protein
MAQTASAQDAAPQQAPLSVIDWLERQSTAPGRVAPATTPAQPVPDEPPVAASGAAPKVTVSALGAGAPRQIGLVPTSVTGLPNDLWQGSSPDVVIKQIQTLPEMHLPAAQALMYTVLLAEAQAPQGQAAAGDQLALARVQKMLDLGALDPAISLIEQAGATTSPAHFDVWMQISLLLGVEDRACAALKTAPHLTQDYGTHILCAARDGRWENAALTYGSAKALELLPPEKLDLIDRFLNPDVFEDAAHLLPPLSMDPLSFRLFESIGEAKPTGPLPRAYAVADLRDVAGWKAQLEAAERLTRAGALPDNRLLGLYTDRKPAASGSIWDRVAALQRFETALGTGSAEAVSKTLPTVWRAMKQAELETAFASLFAERLAGFELPEQAARIAFEVGLLSPVYEATAAQAESAPDTALLRAVAVGEVTTSRPQEAIAAAVHAAFTDATPRADLTQKAQQKQLGESILTLLSLLEDGLNGDAKALQDALATLRTLGLEDTARRAALQVLLLER